MQPAAKANFPQWTTAKEESAQVASLPFQNYNSKYAEDMKISCLIYFAQYFILSTTGQWFISLVTGINAFVTYLKNL